MISGVILYLLLINALIVGILGMLLLLRPLVRKAFGAVAAYRLWFAIPLACAVFVGVSIFSFASDGKIVHQAPNEWDDIAPLYAVPQKQLPDTANDRRDPKGILSIIWIAGMFSSVGLIFIRERNLHHILGDLTYSEDGYYFASNANISPMLVGLFRPKIIVPADFNSQYSATEKSLILAHERAHHAAGDHIVNAVVVLFQCINWFNPFIYLARPQLLLDQELACDARVLTKRPDAMRDYMRALVKAQQVCLDSFLKTAWGPTGDHPLVVRVKQLSLPATGVLSGPKRYLTLTVLFIVFAIAANLVSPIQIVSDITNYSVNTASAKELRLIEAVETGDHDAVLSLLKDGIDPNINIAPVGTPLIIAAHRGDIKLIDMLIGAGARVNYAARGRGFPLLAAVEAGDHATVEHLLSLGARPDARVIENDTSPLVTAARLGEANIVATLLDHKVDPNMIVDDEGTALIAASASGQNQIVDLLIQNDAKVNQSALVERKTPDGHRFFERTTALIEAERTQRKQLSEHLRNKTQTTSHTAPP